MLRLLRNAVGGRRLGEVEVLQTESKPTEASSFPAAQNPPGHIPHFLLPPAGLQAAGGVGWEKQAQERKWGSPLIDSPSAGCGKSSIPKDPIHCPPSIGGKRVPFRREAKRQSTHPSPLDTRLRTLAHREFHPVSEQENTNMLREQGASIILAKC